VITHSYMEYNCNRHAKLMARYARLSYSHVGIIVMKTRSYKSYVEILPAALLSRRQVWQPLTHALPAGSYLLITNSKNKEQTQFMHRLTQLFRAKGKTVVVWKVRKKER
jgi:hypothetical protein